jgi:NAD(P)-dependent dehydrogenase (short-subunit alcohol dehydrogenase family)
MTADGRVCVVTGASRGLGRAIARHLGSNGWSLALCARGLDALTATASEIERDFSVPVVAERVDVADGAAVVGFADAVQSSLGPAYALVNNAGVLGPVGGIDAVDVSAWHDALDVNLLGVMHMMRAFVPQMRARSSGVVVNVLGGGVGGTGVQSHISAYVAAKAAVAVLTETTARELTDEGVRVNAVSPGPLATDLMRPALAAGEDGAGKTLFATARAIYDSAANASPESLATDLAELLDFLLDERSAAFTGRLLSARWNPVAQLCNEDDRLDADQYRLRRIDGELFHGGATRA